MAKIKNMNELREKVLQALDDLEEGKIDISHAAMIVKMSDSVISGLKSEMQYAILTNSQPYLPFYGEPSGIELNKSAIKKLI